MCVASDGTRQCGSEVGRTEGLDTGKIEDREGEWKVEEVEWERGWEAVRKQREGEQREIGT